MSSRPQTNSPSVVPQPPSRNVSAAPKKPAREAGPLVLVPDSLVIDDGKDLEPHWAAAIDTATD
jgi:hypothetical protein